MTSGVAAAGHAVTAEAAELVLRSGGNAFDAALAALAAACVAEPVLASLGGGGFLLACPCDAAPRVYDFFVHTPARQRPADELEFRPIVAGTYPLKDIARAQEDFLAKRHTGKLVLIPPPVAR